MSIWRFHKSEYPDYEITLEYLQEPLIDVSIAIDLEEEILQAVYYETKLAGVPAWLQENETPLCPICAGSMEFLAQIDAELDGPLPASSQEWDSGKYKMFKFGDVGLGYVFICEAECSPDSASFLWQC